MKQPELAAESWDRFLPQFTKRNPKRIKQPKREEKEYNPFPPEQKQRKIDMELESGDYFMKGLDKKEKKKMDEKRKNKAAKAALLENKMESAEVVGENKKELNNFAEKKKNKKQNLVPPEEKEIKPQENRFEPTIEELKNKFLNKKRVKTG